MKLDFQKIEKRKNLLAFSGGVDSMALFYLLKDANIDFDLIIVNYNARLESKEELEFAINLAKKHNKKIFVKELDLKNSSNFEKVARDTRYEFFKEIIKENSYEVLITAHQLNDKLEWFFMQLSKGAGLLELLGMSEFEEKEFYQIYRPLLNSPKKKLQEYLDKNSLKYFIDSSYFDIRYRRNYFRKEFANRFLDEFESGVKNSFEFLNRDLNSLNIKFEAIFIKLELEVFENLNDDNLNLRVVDKSLKKRGVLLSSKERVEILRQKELTIAHKINISIKGKYIFIAPKVDISLPKEFKEVCRVNKIPANIRTYIFSNNITLFLP